LEIKTDPLGGPRVPDGNWYLNHSRV
jgi:hypothetical protein